LAITGWRVENNTNQATIAAGSGQRRDGGEVDGGHDRSVSDVV
jgi:hypothetical protein